MLLVHHLLEHCGGVNAWHIVVLECRHERHCSSCDHKMLSVNITNLASNDILDSHATAFKQIPNCSIQKYTFMIVAS